jgi:ribose transport system substrate-binding protein
VRSKVAATLGVALVVGLTACGGSDSDGSSSEQASSTEPSASDSSAYLDGVKATVDRLLSAQGTYQAPPETAPKPEPGKKVWLISCGQSITACSIPIGGAENAAKSMGWEPQMFDTKGDPTQAGAGIRSAIAQKADGIFIYYIDCKYMRKPLEEAKEAGIPVVGAEVFDCNQTDPGAPELLTYKTTYTAGLDGPYPEPVHYDKFIYDWGIAQALYAIAKTDGKANLLGFSDDSALGGLQDQLGYAAEFEKCAECSYTLVKFPLTAFDKIQELTSQNLLKNPEANAVAGAYDAITTSGVAQAAAASGRDLIVMGGEGSEAGMDMLRSGGKITGGAGMPLAWEAYAAIDNLNRIFHDEPTVGSGIGLQLFDKDHNVPAEGGFKPPVDYVAAYEKAWGVGG